MRYCYGNETHVSFWYRHGISHCHYDTIVPGILLVVGLLFGGIECLVYSKYGTVVEKSRRPKSLLYFLQIVLSVSMAIECCCRAIVIEAFGPAPTYAGPAFVTFLSATMTLFAWASIVAVLMVERASQLPSVPTSGHGLIVLSYFAFAFAAENLAFLSWNSDNWFWKPVPRSSYNSVAMAMWIYRYTATFILFGLAFLAPGLRSANRSHRSRSTYHERLIDEDDVEVTDSSTSRSTWRGLIRKCRLLWPYMWPKKSLVLQAIVMGCVLLLVLGRIVNLFTPLLYKDIIDSLTVTNSTKIVNQISLEGKRITVARLQFRWDYIVAYVVLRFLQGGGFGTMGALNNLRSFMWIWMQQYTSREVGVSLFAHLHGLSLRWHLSRKTGEVLRVMDRGTNSINNLLNYIVFSIAPTIIDIIIAVIYFLTEFNAWFALIVFITMVLYLVMTIVVTEWRTKYRREMNLADNAKNARGVDSLLNFETVKYYSNEKFEVDEYEKAILKYQKHEWNSIASLNVLNSVQNLVINVGLLVGSLLCAWFVVSPEDVNKMTVGDYVLFSTYLVQLYGPLNFFGTYYRMIQQALIDMENMFDLLKERKEIIDNPNAGDFIPSLGNIEFNNVCFHYTPKLPILTDVTFTVNAGQTFAIVGPSGGGKSTIIRLLFRFYDVQSGVIKFDGQDISQLTQDSVRKAIGVVPQDTVLFNSNIRYNIRYGRLTADDGEVKLAAIAADIHNKISQFTEGYNTVVGERGLKLSGGEKQRVAIARTLLKAPQFILLDEATSALDTNTERNIQQSLTKVCEGRTTIVVAHRLSTIRNADCILVLKDGEIKERGTHDELIEVGGIYEGMWNQQREENDFADDATFANVIPASERSPTAADVPVDVSKPASSTDSASAPGEPDIRHELSPGKADTSPSRPDTSQDTTGAISSRKGKKKHST